MTTLARNLCIIVVLAFGLHIERSMGDESHMKDDEVVEKILSRRGLLSPHEVKKNQQPVRECHGKDEKFSNENAERKNLQKELRQCKQRNGELLKELTQDAVNDSLHSLPNDLPYLKRIFRSISEIWRSSNGPNSFQRYFKFQLKNVSVVIIESCLDDKEHFENCMDAILGILKTGQEDVPSKMADSMINILDKVDFLKLANWIITILCFGFSAFIAYSLVRSKHNVFGMIFILLWAAFLVSIPWDWMRLYKAAISRKTVDKFSASPKCFGEKMSYIALIKYSLRDTFSFSDDECLMYYNAEIIDPIWEVSPGQALAASASRIILQPTLVFSEHIGKCFRLIFKEIPVQWQLPVFVAIMCLFVLAIGVEIGGPFFRIGRTGQVIRDQLKAEKDENKELRNQIEQLNRRLFLIRNDSERRDEIKPSGTLHQSPAPVDIGPVQNIPNDPRNVAQHPVENSISNAKVNEGRGLLDHDRRNNLNNQQQVAPVHQETESPSYE